MDFLGGLNINFLGNSSGVNKDFIEFLEKKYLFNKLFRGTVDQFLMEVFRGECNFVEFFRCKRKRRPTSYQVLL